MKIQKTPIEAVYTIEPDTFQDKRGFFRETYQYSRYRELGIQDHFVQDNHSRSARKVLRGLHFQIKKPQAQLLTVLRGHIFDVVVDLRSNSHTFGEWFGTELIDTGLSQIYMPRGVAHGFCVLSDWADLYYKVTQNYDPQDEGGVHWDDPDIGIKWPLFKPLVGERDAAFLQLNCLNPAQLPQLKESTCSIYEI